MPLYTWNTYTMSGSVIFRFTKWSLKLYLVQSVPLKSPKDSIQSITTPVFRQFLRRQQFLRAWGLLTRGTPTAFITPVFFLFWLPQALLFWFEKIWVVFFYFYNLWFSKVLQNTFSKPLLNTIVKLRHFVCLYIIYSV